MINILANIFVSEYGEVDNLYLIELCFYYCENLKNNGNWAELKLNPVNTTKEYFYELISYEY